MLKIGLNLKILILSVFFISGVLVGRAGYERPNLDIALVFDHSFSMFEYKDGRMHEAQVAAINFIDRLDPAYDQVTLIRFSDYAEINKTLGSPFIEVKKKIDSYHLDYFSKFTNLQKAIAKAREELTSARARPNAKKLAILLSDGNNNRPKLNGMENINYAHSLALQETDKTKDEGIIIHTVAVGGSKADLELFTAITSRTGGNSYIATSPLDLIPIYEHIASNLKTNSSGSGGSIYIVNTNKKFEAVPPISIDKTEINNNEIEQETTQINKQGNKSKLQQALLLGDFSKYFKNMVSFVIAALAGAYLTWLLINRSRRQGI